jgi:hypothetical protein
MGGLFQGGSQKEKMILGLKIGIGIVLGIVFINIAFWTCVLFIYGVVWVFESISKLLK